MWPACGPAGLHSGWAGPGVSVRRALEADMPWVRMRGWELELEARKDLQLCNLGWMLALSEPQLSLSLRGRSLKGDS